MSSLVELEVQQVVVLPHTVDWPEYLRRRRAALLQEVRAIEEALDMEPSVRALCPTCRKEWNRKKAG